MTRVLALAAETGRKPTVTAVERALGIPHATFDRNYRHLIDEFRQRAHDQAATGKRTRAVSSGKDPEQVIRRLHRENEDLRRLVKIYAESIRQLTLDHLELQAGLNAAAGINRPAHPLARISRAQHPRQAQQPASRNWPSPRVSTRPMLTPGADYRSMLRIGPPGNPSDERGR